MQYYFALRMARWRAKSGAAHIFTCDLMWHDTIIFLLF